ncbi:MAG TPA: TRAP transporter small permease subunit [Kiloniellaceae bacterium]|nr:TRAP transporter small permease subunit [Kiloniellaceae bacterium]
MELLMRVSEGLDRIIVKVGKIAAWAGLLLILVTVFDVVTRRFFVLGSTKLQELEWHFHTILFAFCLGFAYLKDAHVRIDLVRENLSERTQWWIELAGCLLFLIPYCALVIYFSIEYTYKSFATNEVSASATGLTHRWIIKSAIPLGFIFLALSGVAVVLRKIVELFGPERLRQKVHDIEEAEAEHIEDITLPDFDKQDTDKPGGDKQGGERR